MISAAESKYIGSPRPWCMKKPGKTTPSDAVEVGGRLEPMAISVFMLVVPWRSAAQAPR